MKILIAIPHIFEPKPESLYSSQSETKRESKIKALKAATLENLYRHNAKHWIHASLGYKKPIVTRQLINDHKIEMKIQIYTSSSATLTGKLLDDPQIEIIDPKIKDNMMMPFVASRSLLEQSSQYDIVGYMEDDILIEDPEFFPKIAYVHRHLPIEYAVLPHRCEHIPGRGDVILSGDPDGGRSDLFWDTGEQIKLKWPTNDQVFYRATNPHSGCYFLSNEQARVVLSYWQSCQWSSSFQLSGPLEHAGSGLLLPVLKVMKPTPANYRFLMVRHQDELWKRHAFESKN